MTITGRLGTAALYEVDDPANLSAHVALCRPKNGHELLYLKYYLGSRFGKAGFMKAQIGSTHPHINVRRLIELPIPLLPNAIQQKLAAFMEKARAERHRKIQDANALFASLDGFVLDQLGLTLPALDGHKVHAVRLLDVHSRFDPSFHSPRFRTLRQQIDEGRYKPRTIGNLCNFSQSGFAAGADDQTNDPSLGVPHIRPLNISNTSELHFEGTKMVPRTALESGDILQQGEVLFNNTNSTAWVGKSVVFDADRESACSNHITRLRLAHKEDSPYFLAAVLNAMRGIGYFGLLSTNFNNQAGINLDTLNAVRLPWPKPELQIKIANEVARRRSTARSLRAEADSVWEKAKGEFETALLGPLR